jgi:monoamine oxidase
MKSQRVAVIGGGPGGLMTLYQLQKHANHPFEATIFEAGPRLGGKILTRSFDAAPVPYEAGAAELYDYSHLGEDPLRELIAELGLPTRPMDGSTVFLDQRHYLDDHAVGDHLGDAAQRQLLEFDERAKDWMSPRQFYLSGGGGDAARDPMNTESFDSLLGRSLDPRVRHYVETLVHSDLATEPHRTNASYGLQNYLMNDPRYMRLYTIDGGIERLPLELAQRVEAHLLLNQPVVRVERTDDGAIRVVSKRDDELTEDEFDFVVVALPNNWIPAIDWAGDDLAAAMRGHHAFYDYPAHYLRVSILFERPFWRGRINESYFMVDAFGGCCLYDESSRNGCDSHGVLGWLLGGDAALDLSALRDDELIRRMLDSLPKPLQHGRELFVEGKVHRWTSAVNGLPGGCPARDMDARHQPEPRRHPNLFVVGDYLFDSTLNGVLDSADYVANGLAQEFEAKSLRRTANLKRHYAEMR